MSNQYVVPTLQASVVSEDVRQEVNGMQSLIGVLNVIPAATAPVGLLKLGIWTRWVNGLGKFKQTARILAPNKKTVVMESAVEFELKSLEGQATNVNFFAGVQFPEFGVYQVEITVGGKVAIRYPLTVVQVQQQAPAAAAN